MHRLRQSVSEGLMRGSVALTGAVLLASAMMAAAQAPQVSVKSSGDIDLIESSLHRQAAAGEGLAAAMLEQYPQYYTQLIVRTRSGEVEIHQNYDEVMIIRNGSATVYTGGDPQNLRTVRPGEQRGSGAIGGKPTTLAPGTLAYIPAGTPHQVVVPAQGSIAYIDIKVAHH